jgi:hypothetical protein
VCRIYTVPMAEQLLTYHFHKIVRVINSCESEEHLLATKEMIVNFTWYWKSKKLDIKTLDHYLKYFSILFNYKKSSILNYE